MTKSYFILYKKVDSSIRVPLALESVTKTKFEGKSTMGKMNTLKGNYTGKVGQTVGAKWKNLSTERVYTKPSNPNTEAQQTVRNGFKAINAFVALFADQIRYKSALDTSGMSVRNAIVKLNKEMVATNGFTKADLLISKGGLQKVSGETAVQSAGAVTVTWNKPTATNFTSASKIVAVMVQESSGMVDVVEADAIPEGATGSLTSTLTFDTSASADDIDVYVYFLDKRGSNKVASASDYLSVAIA